MNKLLIIHFFLLSPKSIKQRFPMTDFQKKQIHEMDWSYSRITNTLSLHKDTAKSYCLRAVRKNSFQQQSKSRKALIKMQQGDHPSSQAQ